MKCCDSLLENKDSDGRGKLRFVACKFDPKKSDVLIASCWAGTHCLLLAGASYKITRNTVASGEKSQSFSTTVNSKKMTQDEIEANPRATLEFLGKCSLVCSTW